MRTDHGNVKAKNEKWLTAAIAENEKKTAESVEEWRVLDVRMDDLKNGATALEVFSRVLQQRQE